MWIVCGGEGGGAVATAANRLTVINCHLTWLRRNEQHRPNRTRVAANADTNVGADGQDHADTHQSARLSPAYE